MAKKFEDMTPAQQRVAIAKDVLKQLDARKIKALRGTYFRADLGSDSIGKELRDELVKVKKCEVCALGSLFVAAVDVRDAYVVKAHPYIDNVVTPPYQQDMHEYLSDIFDGEQLELIENAFEGKSITSQCECDVNGECDDGLCVAARYFRRRHAPRSDAGRLRALMENIIRNRGTFVVADYV